MIVLHGKHNPGHVLWVGSVQYADPAQPRTTAGEEPDHLR